MNFAIQKKMCAIYFEQFMQYEVSHIRVSKTLVLRGECTYHYRVYLHNEISSFPFILVQFYIQWLEFKYIGKYLAVFIFFHRKKGLLVCSWLHIMFMCLISEAFWLFTPILLKPQHILAFINQLNRLVLRFVS